MNPSVAPLSRKERERVARRRDMLEAARLVLAEKGYAGATLEEIATRAEFGKGTLYNYFPGGKEEILFAVIEELYDDLVEIAASELALDRVENGATIKDGFLRFVRRCFDYYEEREELFMILTKEAYRMSFSDRPERASYILNQRRRLVNAMTPALRAGAESSLLQTADPDTIAHMILGNIHGYQMHRCLLNRPEVNTLGAPRPTAAQAAEFVTTMLFDGLLVRAQQPTTL